MENTRNNEAVEFILNHKREDEFLNLNEWETRELLRILSNKNYPKKFKNFYPGEVNPNEN